MVAQPYLKGNAPHRPSKSDGPAICWHPTIQTALADVRRCRDLQLLGSYHQCMWMLGGVVVALALTAAALQYPALVVVLLIATVGSLLLLGRSHLTVPLTIIAAATALPAFVPTGFSVGGFSVRVYELLLVGAFFWAIAQPARNTTLRTVVVLLLWLLLGTATAWVAAGAQLVRIVGDVRYPAEMVMAVIVAAAAVAKPGLVAACMRAMRFSLWISASVIALASAGLISIAGRSEAASLFESGNDSGTATRFLTDATFFALATLAVCTAIAVDGRISLLRSWSWSVPAILTLLLAFSRNHLLGIGVTVICAVLLVRSWGAFRRAFAGAILVAGVAGVIVTAAPLLSDVPGGSWFASQVSAYSSRVVGGLRSDALARDSSAAYREHELGNLRAAFDTAPAIGHGFGYAYQAPRGEKGTFWYDRAPYYSHNFYWWTLAKTGVVGLTLVLLAMLGPLLSSVRQTSRNPQLVCVAATLAGLLAVAWFAPLPLEAPNSLLIGSFLGAVLGFASTPHPYKSRNSIREDGGELVLNRSASLVHAGPRPPNSLAGPYER